MTKKDKTLYDLKQLGLIFLATLLTAVALEFFLLPSDVIVGGALGIASILDIILSGLSSSVWYMSTGVWVILINIPIVFYCFAKYKRRFAVKTLLYVVLVAVELLVLRLLNVSALLENALYPDGSGSDKVMYTLLGGAIQGLSLPLMLSINGSTGGSDIVGLIMQRKNKKSSSESMRGILITNVIIVLISSLAYFWTSENNINAGMNMLVYSIAAMFIGEIVQETVFKGFSAAIELEVTTDKPQEMAEKLRTELMHGTTIIKAEGGYSHTEKTMVICVVNKRQLTKARRIIRQVDDSAFAYVENVKEVMGKGFANKEIELENDDK